MFELRSELGVALARIAERSHGHLGVCVLPDGMKAPICVRGHEEFPLQSVMKLIVSAAVLDCVDRGEIQLGGEIAVRPADISPGPEEFANQVLEQGGLTVTVEELIRRCIIDSDSTSVDVLINCIGGVPAIRDFINCKGLSGLRVDRTERELQTESVGLSWRPEYVDLKQFEAAIRALPVDRRAEAWRSHITDPRDRATPVGTAEFLSRLMTGRLLSAVSTEKLLGIMRQTATGRDRLRAGLFEGWQIAHKTGTGRTWQGETETTNDVGILTTPDGAQIALAVFLARSSASAKDQASSIASVARLVSSYYGVVNGEG